MSWAAPDDIFFSTSLAAYLDKKLLVLLRDGRKLMGLLRSFDQFGTCLSLLHRKSKVFEMVLRNVSFVFGFLEANAVLEEAYERVIVGDLYCDIPLGLYIIRGENVVLIGELDVEKEELPAHMVQVPEAEIKRAQKAEKEEMLLKGTMRKRMEFLDLD
jgi:U6 snRNA-associated Sm-like protein LSm1